MALTDKQIRFCEEYLIDLNATQAAIRAGYSQKTAGQIASETLMKPYIKEYITALKPSAIAKQSDDFKKKRENQRGFIYLIKCEGTHYYKIGITTNRPETRLRILQTSLPFDLKMVISCEKDFVSEVEKRLHVTFKEHHIRGEWFLFSPALIMKVIKCSRIDSCNRKTRT